MTSQNRSQVKPGRIPELDGWRGISMLLVILHHSMYFAFPAVADSSRLFSHFFHHIGELGVQIFFVISGFVITRLLIAEEREQGSVSLKGFYTRRLFRILPVYYFYLLVVSIFSWAGWTPVSGIEKIVSVFFLYDTKIVSNGWFAGHSWSLAVEEQFYIVFPIFWVLSPPKRRATVLFLTLAAFLTWTAFSQWGYGANLISRSSIIGFSCINVGALLAIFEPRAIRFSAGLPSLAIFLVSALLFIHPVSTSTLASGLYSVCVPFGIALMLMYSIGHTGWISSALKHPVILWCGLISYSAYLWQEVFTGAADSYGSPGAAKVFHFMVPLIPLVAGVSFYCIERPCTRLGRRLSARISGRNASNAPLRVAAS